ncbi:unnamed protein product, partial [marine sediment metagenome]
MKKIVIAAVNGYALAGGTGFAVCCDLVIAAEDAVFGLLEINVGLFPMTIAPAMVRNVTSLKKCLELFVTGDRFSAQEAESMGLVNKVVPPDKLEEATMELARKIASKSPTTLQIGKQFFYNMLDMEYTQATKYAAEMISIVAVSEDGQEGQRAFIEKREPRWKKLGVNLTNDADAVFSQGADIVIQATGSALLRVKEQLISIINAGLNVVSTCEELSYPWDKEPGISAELDALAKEKECYC